MGDAENRQVEYHEEEDQFVDKAALDHALSGFSAILTPVTVTMVLAASAVIYLTPDSAEDFQDSSLLILQEDAATDGKQQAGFALANALVIIGVITGMTFLIVFFIYMGWEKLFAAYIFLAMLMLMGFTTGVVVVEGLRTYEVSTDIATLAFFFYNFAVCGVMAIFSFEVGFQGPRRLIPLWVTQFYLVIISVVMAWLVTNIFGDFTTWALLVCLALYDLCAVLTPCGPLNLLIQVVSKRQEANPNSDGQMIPGLLYEVNTGRGRGQPAMDPNAPPPQRSGAAAAGPLGFMAEPARLSRSELGADDQLEENHQEENYQQREVLETDQIHQQQYYYAENKGQLPQGDMYEYELEDSNLKLGLGDFVFYSVLCAKSADFGFVAFVSVACCILCGLCGTLVLLSVYQKALPALPISIALGVTVYLIANFFISPFVDELAVEGISV